MGVPITFLDKFNPEQFEIIGSTESDGNKYQEVKELWIPKDRTTQTSGYINGKAIFKRILIKNMLKEKLDFVL